MQESDFDDQKLIDSFICTDLMIFKSNHKWKDLVCNGLDIKTKEAYLVYFCKR